MRVRATYQPELPSDRDGQLDWRTDEGQIQRAADELVKLDADIFATFARSIT